MARARHRARVEREPRVGIEERRKRERQRREAEIVEAAWDVADRFGWGGFSMERVAARAELGRATLYSYFISIDDLVAALARFALAELQDALANAETAEEAMDVPVRLSQKSSQRFALLFPGAEDPRPHMSSKELRAVQAEAHDLLRRIAGVAARQSSALPTDARERAAFLAGVSMAGATIPELRSSTTLRHRWQRFCLGEQGDDDG